jgi:hypothetical protein
MDDLVKHDLLHKVQWANTDATMEVIIPTSKLNIGDLEKITHKINTVGGKLANGPRVFDKSTGGWHLDKYNAPKVYGRVSTGSSSRRGKMGNQRQKQKQKQKQKQVVTDTEVEESEGSQSTAFPPPSSDQSMDNRTYRPGKANKVSTQTVEGKWTSVFNVILGVMHKQLKHIVQSGSSGSHPALDNFPFLFDNPPRRYWSSKFANTPVPDETNAQKPDIVLLDQEVMLHNKITWADVLTGVEITDTDFSKDAPVYIGLATKAYLMMREQPWRRFVVMFSIAAKHLRAHYFDRSGLIITHPIQIDKKPLRLVDMLNTMTLGKRETLGFDPTMHMCSKMCTNTHKDLRVGAIGWIKHNAQTLVTYSIMEVLWRSQGLFSRGTTCYRVQDDSGVEYALKDCWVEEVKKRHEVDILNMVAGTPNVVTLVDEWDVMYDGEPDSTSRIRQRTGSLPAADGYCNRFHRRMLLTPCGKPLSTFSSKSQLLSVFRDLVIGEFRRCFECGVLTFTIYSSSSNGQQVSLTRRPQPQ